MLVVDAANVVGSRPNGWWRDRAQAAANLCAGLIAATAAGQLQAPVVVVLEGAARRGVLLPSPPPAGGDDTIIEVVAQGAGDGYAVTVVTADRELRDRARRVGGDVVGPTWLLDRL
jgi:hypothetical protein